MNSTGPVTVNAVLVRDPWESICRPSFYVMEIDYNDEDELLEAIWLDIETYFPGWELQDYDFVIH